MRKKIIMVLVAIVCFVSLFTACGKKPVTIAEYSAILEKEADNLGYGYYERVPYNSLQEGEDTICSRFTEGNDAVILVDFSVWETEKLAEIEFNDDLETSKERFDDFSSKSNTYTCRVNDEELIFSERIDNTVIWICYNDDRSDNVDQLLKALGY